MAILALVLVMCNSHLEHTDASQPVSTVQGVDTVPMLITQVQKCAKLYTAEYHVHKIVTHDDVVRLKGTLLKRGFDIKMPVGDRKIAIPIDAKLKAYIDFSTFSEENIERQGKEITIILPDPQVTMTSSKIDCPVSSNRGVKPSSPTSLRWASSKPPRPMLRKCWCPCSRNWATTRPTSPLLSASIMNPTTS